MSYTTVTDTTSSSLNQADPIELTTTNATQTNMGTAISLPSGSVTTVDMQITAIQGSSGKAKVFAIRRHFLNNGGTVTASAQEDLTGPTEIGGSLAASVELAVSGTTVQLKVTGVSSGGDVLWRRDVQTIRVGGSSLPASLGLQIWGRAPSGAAALPWAGVSSAGSSGSREIDDASSTGVTGGSAVNGYYPAAFSGSGKYLQTRAGGANVNASSIFGSSGGTIIVLAKPTTASADQSATIDNPGIVSVNGAGMFQMGFSSAGLRVSTYDNTALAYKEAPAVAASNNAWHLFAARFTGSAVQASVDGSDFTSASTASSAYPSVSQPVLIGANYAGTNTMQGLILEVMLGDFAISQSDLNWLKTNYFNARYNLAL